MLISWLISFQRLFLSPVNQVSSLVPYHSVTSDIYAHGMQRLLDEAESSVWKHMTIRPRLHKLHATQQRARDTPLFELEPFSTFLCSTEYLHLCFGQFVCQSVKSLIWTSWSGVYVWSPQVTMLPSRRGRWRAELKKQTSRFQQTKVWVQSRFFSSLQHFSRIFSDLNPVQI